MAISADPWGKTLSETNSQGGGRQRVLVVGLGTMGLSHARAYRAIDGFDLVGLCTRNAAAREDLDREFPGLPRFEEENIRRNLAAVEKLEQLAAKKGKTAAQLALAWVLAQGDFIVPIPGSRKIANLEANVEAASVALSDDEIAEIGALVTPDTVAGKHYAAAAMAQTNG